MVGGRPRSLLHSRHADPRPDQTSLFDHVPAQSREAEDEALRAAFAVALARHGVGA